MQNNNDYAVYICAFPFMRSTDVCLSIKLLTAHIIVIISDHLRYQHFKVSNYDIATLRVVNNIIYFLEFVYN